MRQEMPTIPMTKEILHHHQSQSELNLDHDHDRVSQRRNLIPRKITTNRRISHHPQELNLDLGLGLGNILLHQNLIPRKVPLIRLENLDPVAPVPIVAAPPLEPNIRPLCRPGRRGPKIVPYNDPDPSVQQAEPQAHTSVCDVPATARRSQAVAAMPICTRKSMRSNRRQEEAPAEKEDIELTRVTVVLRSGRKATALT
jgi:hypothetical protein